MIMVEINKEIIRYGLIAFLKNGSYVITKMSVYK